MTPTEVRFAADGMLQSLATWLRLLGYDCTGGNDQFGRRLLEEAIVENRVFLTRNIHIGDVLPRALVDRAQIVHVAGEHLPEQLRELVEKFSLEREEFVFTRCVECNRPLRRQSKSEAAGHVPSDVAEREQEFWHCTACGKTFWRGSHVQNSVERLHRWLSTPSRGVPSSG